MIVKVYTKICKATSIQRRVKISSHVIHLSITYLDIAEQSIKWKQFTKQKWTEIAIGCLSLASKFDEMDERIPLTEEFLKFADLKISPSRFLDNEKFLLNSIFNWNLNLLTVCHFVELYIKIGVVFVEEWVDFSNTS